MKKLVIFFIAMLLLIPTIYADWFYNSKNIIVNVDVSSDAQVVQTETNGYIDSASINMTFYPKQTDTQQISNLYTDPDAILTGDILQFHWKNPISRFNFKINANVKTTNTLKEIKEKIIFPIKALPENLVVYTNPSLTIDSNDEDIIRLASELVKGEDDLYSAVSSLLTGQRTTSTTI